MKSYMQPTESYKNGEAISGNTPISTPNAKPRKSRSGSGNDSKKRTSSSISGQKERDEFADSITGSRNLTTPTRPSPNSLKGPACTGHSIGTGCRPSSLSTPVKSSNSADKAKCSKHSGEGVISSSTCANFSAALSNSSPMPCSSAVSNNTTALRSISTTTGTKRHIVHVAVPTAMPAGVFNTNAAIATMVGQSVSRPSAASASVQLHRARSASKIITSSPVKVIHDSVLAQ